MSGRWRAELAIDRSELSAAEGGTAEGQRPMKEQIATELDAVRRRSLDLLDPVPEDDLLRQHSPLMSPLVWDLAHVGNYEEQWLLGAVADTRVAAHLDGVPRGSAVTLR